MKRPRSSNDAIVESSAGPHYTGRAGATRSERVHLVEGDGSMRSVEVYRVVNVVTHPELKARVLSGQLHRLDDGRELAIPFIYHDPSERRFALVIPPSLAHLEMKEWSSLMQQLADDTRSPVPSYVRDCTTALGLGALEIFLESVIEPDDGELHEVSVPPEAIADKELRERQHLLEDRERLVEERSREASEQEQALMRLAQDLTAREARVKTRENELEEERSELSRRERTLSERVRRAEDEADVVPEGDWQEISGDATANTSPNDEATVIAQLQPTADGGHTLSPRKTPPPLHRASSAPGREPPPLRPRGGGPPPLNPESRRAAAADPHSPVSAQPPPLRRDRSRDSTNSSAPTRNAATPTRPPPPPPSQAPEPALDLGTIPRGRFAVETGGDELIFHLPLVDESERKSFGRGTDLLVQLADGAGHPVLLLTLVDPRGPAARAPFDAADDGCRALLGRLERNFRARLICYDGGQPREPVELSASRESVARAVRVRIEAIGAPSGGQLALETVMAAPPPVRNKAMPFVPSAPPPESPAAAARQVRELEAWTAPDRLDQAVLIYSVPRHVIEASSRRILRGAMAHGIALPERLIAMTIQHGIAAERRHLVSEQLRAFAKRVEAGDNDLDAAATLRNWERLFVLAGEVDVEVGGALIELAERAAREGGMRLTVSLPAATTALGAALGDPARRMAAIEELCQRRHPSALAPIFEVLDALSPDEVASATAALLVFGDRAGDGLITGLASPSQFVRHACALCLGQLAIARGLPALIGQLQAESTDSWGEMARAIGGYGGAGVAAVAGAVPGAARPERLMVALAHLAARGQAVEIEALTHSPLHEMAAAARQALTRRDRVEAEDRSVRENRALRDNSPEARFSQNFFAAIARHAA
ncbi:MAG: hypothetical protein OEZ06_16155 [Myxococcales bacterium]|nr:hypothetical protein [Myxococcales bacterium]